jgi:pilus assembly protein Flp/PilA
MRVDMMPFMTEPLPWLRSTVRHLFEREEGQDMIEYALLAALISIVAIAIILLVGPYLDNLFKDVVNALGTA